MSGAAGAGGPDGAVGAEGPDGARGTGPHAGSASEPGRSASAAWDAFRRRLAHPVLNASGTFDALAARRVFGDALLARFPFAAYVTKTVTLDPRAGNPPPRLWELPAGLMNSIGLPNKGLRAFLAEDLPALAELPVPLVVNVMGASRAAVAELVEAVGGRDEVAALELNVSCPNVKTGLTFGAHPGEVAALLADVRALTSKPLVVKLTPNCTAPAEVAAAAEAHGADAVSLVNTLRGLALHPSRPGEPWLGGRTGGVSGPAIRAVALAQVAEVRARTTLPIVGMGGVQRGRHAHDLMRAGADLVAVGTESFRDPLAGARVAEELAQLGAAHTGNRDEGEEIPANAGLTVKSPLQRSS